MTTAIATTADIDNSRATLIGHRATREEVFALQPPEHTRSWKPVAYADSVQALHETIRTELRCEVVNEDYALNSTGTQLFHVAQVDVGTSESGLAIGLRQSYDKTLSLGVVAGAQVFVCSNLCFNGSAFQVMRKNTTFVWDDYVSMIRKHIRNASVHYSAMQEDFTSLKSVPCNKRRGYAMLGVALGEGVLKPNQATVAYADWDEPRHEEFGDRNLWGLYNAVTEGLKKGSAATVIDRYTDAHHWFKGFLPA